MSVIEIETGDSDVVEVETSTDTVEITSSGQPGPPGPTGPEGPQGDPGPSGQAAGKILYYAISDPSDITGYKTLLASPSGGGEQTINTACSGTSDVLIAAFATDPGVPGAVDYPAGTAFRRIYAMVDRGSARLHLQIFSRDAAGVETLVRDEFSPTFTNQAAGLQEWLSTSPAAGALQVTDRIVNRLYAQRVTGTQPVTVTTYWEGSSHASQIQTTISAGAQGPTGPQGPPGPPGAATTPLIKLTQAEYDLLAPPDPDSLYVIIG